MLRRVMRPRRPLLGAAVVGGTAYAAGRGRAQAQVHEQEQEQRLASLEAEQAQATYQPAPPAPAPAPAPAPPPAAATAPPASDDIASQLMNLKGLVDQGVLTPQEFEQAKQRLLAG